MMQDVAKELQIATGAFSFDNKLIQVLDLCMAPGGFTAYSLYENPMGVIDAFSLPEAEGGHPVLALKHDKRVRVHFTDITMWPEELGVDNVPDNHPDISNFCSGWPCSCRAYDLVICDGQALDTHDVAEYRKRTEQTRLINSQLVLGLQRIKAGGTLIVLLHRLYKWRCVKLLYTFSCFSDIQLFKHKRYHAVKPSFYLVARNVQSKTEMAIQAINTFRDSWCRATFGTDQGEEEHNELDANELIPILAKFGPTFIELARPAWAIQAAALKQASWMRKDGTAEETGEEKAYQNGLSVNKDLAKTNTASESSIAKKL